MRKYLLAVPLAVVVAIFSTFMLLSTSPRVAWSPPVTVVGDATPVTVKIDSPHGIRRVTAWMEQDGSRYPMFETTRKARRIRWDRNQPVQTMTLPVGKERAQGLKEGKARVIVEAEANDFRGGTHRIEQEVQVNTQPPRITADEFQHYINQGGSELVTFTVSGYWTEAGVRVGKYTFRSFPLPSATNAPGQPQQRFSLFAYPWDLPANASAVVYARNPSGAEVTAPFWQKVFPKQFRTRDLELPEPFLQKVTSELGGGSGTLLERFLRINGAMRHQNNATLAALRERSEPKVLWNGPFQQLGNSKVEAQFADVRNYMYQGRKVDQQVHLGFDLSVTKNVPVVASGAGRVAHAAPLGIYGNCIVVDHGYGLQSIYAHLSEIGVKTGQMVERGQALGRSGATGLAGGDHLHFSMQVDGVQINPVEWWDGHWIQDRVLSKLPVGKAAPAPTQRAAK